jgi:hypothetical protein
VGCIVTNNHSYTVTNYIVIRNFLNSTPSDSDSTGSSLCTKQLSGIHVMMTVACVTCVCSLVNGTVLVVPGTSSTTTSTS